MGLEGDRGDGLEDVDLISDLVPLADTPGLLGISRPSVYSLERAGHIVGVKLGGRKFFLRSSINAHLARQVREQAQERLRQERREVLGREAEQREVDDARRAATITVSWIEAGEVMMTLTRRPSEVQVSGHHEQDEHEQQDDDEGRPSRLT